mgnify:CR=1 FL=1
MLMPLSVEANHTIMDGFHVGKFFRRFQRAYQYGHDRVAIHNGLMKPFKIRNIEIDPPLILSPMAGVTDYTFRRLIKRRGGVGLVVSEFISVEGLTRGNPKSRRQMHFDEEERPYAVQIFGGQAERNGDGA